MPVVKEPLTYHDGKNVLTSRGRLGVVGKELLGEEKVSIERALSKERATSRSSSKKRANGPPNVAQATSIINQAAEEAAQQLSSRRNSKSANPVLERKPRMPPWFSPGRTRLSEVHPTKVLEKERIRLRHQPRRHVHQEGDFQSSTRQEMQVQIDGLPQHNVVFNGMALNTWTTCFGDDNSSSDGGEDGDEVGSLPESVDNSPVYGANPWSGVKEKVGGGFLHRCLSKNHPVFLRDQIYAVNCQDQQIALNSGITGLLNACPGKGTCFCNLEVVNFSNFGLGDRGMKGMYPLLMFGRMLRCLNLGGNGMRTASFFPLIALLEDPFVLARLVALDLSHNPLSTPCVGMLQAFLPKRPKLILIGLANTDVDNRERQRLVDDVFKKFQSADDKDMLECWRFAGDRKIFHDRELAMKCKPIVEEKFGREMIERALWSVTPTESDSKGGSRSSTPARSSKSIMMQLAASAFKTSTPPPDAKAESPGSG